MTRDVALTIAFSFLTPTIVFFIVAAHAGAPHLITTFLLGLLVMGAAVAGLFAFKHAQERQAGNRP
jgi:hypothetical protein